MIARIIALFEALTASDLEAARPTDLGAVRRSVPALGQSRGPEPRDAGQPVAQVRTPAGRLPPCLANSTPAEPPTRR
jgi:hypothetical protein